MLRTDKKTLEVLARVHAGNREFVAWMKTRLQEHHVDVGQQRDEVSLRWAQGRVQELTDLIEALEKSSELL